MKMFADGFVNYDKQFIKKKIVSGKLLLVMAYLRLRASYSGKVIMSIDYLAESLGYRPNKKTGKINESIVESLLWLKQKDYISFDMDIRNRDNHSKCFVCQINNDNNIFDMIRDDNVNYKAFVQITEEEFDRIINSPYKRKDCLFVVFMHMKKRIFINGVGQDGNYCFASLDTIQRDASNNVKISRSSVANVIDELVRIGLLFEHITGEYVDCHEKLRAAVNFYSLREELMNHDECDAIAKFYIEENEGVIVDNFIKKGIRYERTRIAV